MSFYHIRRYKHNSLKKVNDNARGLGREGNILSLGEISLEFIQWFLRIG